MPLSSSLRLAQIAVHYFFFQAEDGIRDYKVTGVQTCALPISVQSPLIVTGRQLRYRQSFADTREHLEQFALLSFQKRFKIGRASCRERVEISAVAGGLRKKCKEKED